MGTTATVAGVLGDTLYSRRWTAAPISCATHGQQITKDQSLMQKLIEAGEITEAEAEQSERRNIILQALGPERRSRWISRTRRFGAAMCSSCAAMG